MHGAGSEVSEITTWIRAKKEDFKLVKELGIKGQESWFPAAVITSSKMQMTRRQVVDYYLETIRDAFEAGVVPRCHLEDITRADFYGFVVPFVNEIMKLSRRSQRSGKDQSLRYHGLWRTVYRSDPSAKPGRHHLRTSALRRSSKRNVEWHGHNDFSRLWPTHPPRGFTEPER